MNPRRTIGRRKIDRFRFAAGMGFAFCLGGIILQLAHCNTSGTVSGPEKTPEVSTPSTQPAATTPAPTTPVADPTTTPDHECSVGKNGSFSITNKSPIIQQYAAWWTDFDDQDTVRGTHGPFQFQPGDSMIGSFNKQCIQVDVGQSINGTPFCFGFIDKEGNTFVPSRAPDKVAACRTKPCVEPRETPTTPGAYSWAPDILEGQCEQEVGPVGVDAVAPALNCHQIGTQKWTVDYQCREDGEKIVDLCRNVACPTPQDVCPNLEGNQLTLPEGYHFGEDENGRTICIKDCVEQWILGPEVIVNDGEPSACEVARPNDPFACSQKQKTLKERFETNTCTQEVRPAPGYPKKGVTQVTGCTCPEALLCYYNNQGENGKEQCQAQPGFVSWNDVNHLCALTFPGISSDDFQLNPGQSEKGCLDKHPTPPAVQ